MLIHIHIFFYGQRRAIQLEEYIFVNVVNKIEIFSEHKLNLKREILLTNGTNYCKIYN